MADNNLEILIVQAMLDKTISTENIKKDLLDISKMIGSLKLSVNIDNTELTKLANSVELITKGISSKKIEIFDKSQLQEGQKLYATLQDVKDEYSKLGSIKITNSLLNPITKELEGFSIAITNADNKVEKLKFDLLNISNGDKITQMFTPIKLTQTDPIASNDKAYNASLLQEQKDFDDFVTKQEQSYQKYLDNTGKSLLQEDKEWSDFVAKQELNYQKLNELQTKQDVAQLKLGLPVAAAPKFDLNFQEAQDYAKTIAGLDAELRSIGYSINAAGEKIQTLGIQTKEGGKYQKDWTATLNEATGQAHLFEKGLSDVAVRQLGFVEKFKVMAQSIPLWLVGMSAIMQTLHFFTDGIAYVNEFNATLTQIGTAVNYSQGKLAELGKSFQQLAKDMHASTTDISAGALEFYRQGLNDDQVLTRLKTTTEYAKISGLAFTQSADLLTAASTSMKTDIGQVADVFTLLGDKTATSASEIGLAFQKVGTTAESLQIPFEKVAAMIATVSAVTRQAPETVGTAINSILSRVESVRKIGYDSADGTTINQVSQALSKAGVQLTDTSGQFRNFSLVLDELSIKWKSLDTVTQRYVATTLAGTRQQTQFLAMMANYNQVLDLNSQALNAAGTTQSKYDIYLQGTQAHMDSLKNSMQGLWSDSFKSQGINDLIDALTFLVTGVGSVVHEFGLLPTVVGLASAAFFTFKKDSLQGFYDILKSIPKTMEAFRLSLIITATTTEGLSIAVKGLGAALLSIGEFLLPIAIIAGLTYGITSLFSAISAHNQAMKEATTLNYDNVNSLTAQKKGLSDLSTEYSNLKSAQDAGNATIDQKQRLLAVQQELVDKYGVSITGINAEGKAYSDSIGLINARTKALQDQIDKENALNKTKLVGKDTSNTEDILSASSGVDKAKKKLDDYQKQLIEFEKRASSGRITNSDNFLPDVPSQLDITTKDNPDSVQNIREGLNFQIGVLQKDFETANGKLQDSLKDRVTILSNESNQYIKSLTDSGTKISDQQRLFVQGLVSSIAQDGKHLDSQIEEIKTAVNKLKDSNFNKILDDFNTAKTNGDQGRMAEDKKQVLALLDTIVSADPKFNSFKSSIMLLFGDGVATKTVVDYDTSLKNLDNSIDAIDKSISTLATAYQKLKSGQQLSTDETLKLADEYPALLDYLSKHNGKIEDQGNILQWVAEQDNKKALVLATNLKNDLDDTYKTLEAKRKMYEQFYTEIQSATNIFPSFGGDKKSGFGNQNNSPLFQLTPEEQQQLNDYNKASKEAQLRIDLLSKPIDLSKVNKSGSSTDTTASETKRDMDVFAREQKAQDDLLVVSDAHLTKYKDTTKAYRDELASQIPIYQEKQKLAHEERLSLDDVNAGIQKRLDTEKLTKSQQNTLYNDMDNNNNKIAALQKSWLDYDKTLSDISNKNSLSLVNEAIDKSADSTKKFDDKIKSLKTSMDSLKTDPAAKIADQNELLKVYSDEQDAIIKTNGELEALNRTLDKNSDAYTKNADEITKNNATLEQLTANVDSERQKVATQVVDTMKKGIQTEIEAEKSLHDAKIKNIDDATNAAIAAIDKIQQANDYNKNLEKDQTDYQKLQTQINAYSLDTSNESQSKILDLKQQQATLKEKIDDEQTKRSNEIVKQSLQDQNKATKDSLDDQSKIKTDALTNQLNDDTHWLDLQTQLMNGHIEGIQTDMKKLIDGLGTYAQQSIGVAETQISKIKTMMSNLGGSSTQVGNLPPINSNPASSGGSGSSGSSGGTSSGFYIPKDQNETDTITTMKKYAANWANASSAAEKKQWADLNQNWGKQIGATYDSGSGKWSKGGLPLYHDGGEVGISTSMGQKLHKLLNLGQGEFPSILKNGELVLKNPVNAVQNLMNSIKMPDFSKLMNKSGGAGGNSFNVNLGGITIQGTQAGADQTIGLITNGLKRLGVVLK